MSSQQMTLGNHLFQVELWDGVKDPLQDTHLVIDTETLPIVLGKVPPVSTLQMYYPHSEFVQIVQGPEAIQLYLKRALELNPGCEVVGHNFAFDFEVLGGRSNDLLMKAVSQSRAVCTGMRFMLKVMSEGKWQDHQKWSLDFCLKSFHGLVLEKDQELRLSFKPDVPLTDAQIHYAALDPVATWMVYEAMPNKMPTEGVQVKGAICLNRISINGLRVNRKKLKSLQEKFEKAVKLHENVLHAFGYFIKVKNNTQRLQAILRNIELRSGLVFPRQTKNPDKICTGAKLVALYPDNVHPFLSAAKEQAHANKMLSTFLNDRFIGEDERVHPRINSMLATTRTAMSDPPMQTIPKGDDIRGQYEAALGFCLLACDYCQQELLALAENCFIRFGFSKMMEVIQSGVDIHKWFGKLIMQQSGGNINDGTDYRQLARNTWPLAV